MAIGSAPNWAHVANNVPSMLGVGGTLGTADTSGTALTVPIGVDPLTGAQYVSIIGTTANGTSYVQISGGTVSVNELSGTINVGTVNVTMGTIGAGTLQTLGTVNIVQNAGTIQGGTLQNLVSGTFNAGTFTLNSKPGSQILTFGTAGTAAIGTLIAAPGVGTSIYVTGFAIDGDSSLAGTTEVLLSFGTVQTGAGVLFRASMSNIMAPAIRSYNFPVSANLTNTPLTFLIVSGAGSVSWTVDYFVQ